MNCLFWGHEDIYDIGLPQKLQSTRETVFDFEPEGGDCEIRRPMRAVGKKRLENQPPQICGIIGFTSQDAENTELLEAFCRTVRFLLSTHNITLFLVEQVYCFTPFFWRLLDIVGENPGVKVKIVTHDGVGRLKEQGRRAQILLAHQMLIDSADVVLCKLDDESPFSICIKNYLKHLKRVKVFDLGKDNTK